MTKKHLCYKRLKGYRKIYTQTKIIENLNSIRAELRANAGILSNLTSFYNFLPNALWASILNGRVFKKLKVC